MRKFLIITLILSLLLVGCTTPDSHSDTPNTFDSHLEESSEDWLSQTDSSVPLEGENSGPAISDLTPTTPTVPDSSENSTEETTPAGSADEIVPTETQSPQQATEAPTTPTTQPEETKPTTPPETTPTQPPETKPEETELPTSTPPTQPTGCSHEWKCIHHPEEGHWRAGIICDCGWTVYGDPGELTALWNAHSASYPPVESLFDHGRFGSMDDWIVDKPAYDEWVCRHCGEPKT